MFALGRVVLSAALRAVLVNGAEVVLVKVHAPALDHPVPSVVSDKDTDGVVLQLPLQFVDIVARPWLGDVHDQVTAALGGTSVTCVNGAFFGTILRFLFCFFGCHVCDR